MYRDLPKSYLKNVNAKIGEIFQFFFGKLSSLHQADDIFAQTSSARCVVWSAFRLGVFVHHCFLTKNEQKGKELSSISRFKILFKSYYSVGLIWCRTVSSLRLTVEATRLLQHIKQIIHFKMFCLLTRKENTKQYHYFFIAGNTL